MADRRVRGYVRAVGLRRVDELDLELVRLFGQARGQAYVDRMNELFDVAEARQAANIGLDAHVARQTEMVDITRENDEIALACASFYDRDALPRILDALVRHAAGLQGQVLDVGCGDGMATCFVAQINPQARVWGIDLSANALACGRRLAGRLGIGNARFAQVDEIEGKTFDTVLSIRTFHENMAHVPEARARAMDPAELAQRCEQAARAYAGELAGLVAPGGRLITIERVIDEHSYAGMLRAIAGCGLRPAAGLLGRDHGRAYEEELACRSGDETVTLRVARFVR